MADIALGSCGTDGTACSFLTILRSRAKALRDQDLIATPGITLYASAWRTDPAERVKLIKDGLPSEILVVLALDMGISKDTLSSWLGIPRASARRKIRSNEALSREEGSHALGLARLVGKVEHIIEESRTDTTDFKAPRWLSAWLNQPHPALRGAMPCEFLDTSDGRELVSSLIGQMQSTAYA